MPRTPPIPRVLRSPLIAAVIASALLVTARAIPAQLPARIRKPALAPCTVRGLSGDVRCGTVRVPENRARPHGRQIDLRVVVARATGAAREPDPFVLLAGGPGQAGTQMGEFATTAFGRVRERRDLVLIDARGTGRSNGLACAMLRRPEDLGAWTMFPPASVRLCRDSLRTVADLAQYTTAAIADDLEAVRRTFGWPALNLYGTSYGTRLALVYLRRHPRGARTVVLKAVAPPSLIAPMNYAEDAERAFGLLVRDCRAEPVCAAAFPDPRADLDTVLARAAAGAIRAVVPRGADTTIADTVRLSRDAVAATLMTALQSSGSRARLPMLLHQAAAAEAEPLAALVVQIRQALSAQEIAVGMHLSVSCGEDARKLDTAGARRADGRTFLGGARVRMLAAACQDWAAPPATPGAYDPVRSAVPVLLVSGDLDPNTPPRHAEAALRLLPNGRHVVLRGVAHGWSNVAACGSAFVADFVARASTRDLELTCADVSSAPPFVTPARRP